MTRIHNVLSFAVRIQIWHSAAYPGWSEAAMMNPTGESELDAVRIDFDPLNAPVSRFRGDL
jgi:hypothetical protein